MKLVPVLDLLGGQVVRAVGGRRSEYRPIESRLVNSAEPAAVASALTAAFEVDTFYVADLDAIAGRRANRAAYRAIASTGARLWLDAGVGTSCAATELRQFLAAAKIDAEQVIGLETLPAASNLDDLVSRFGADFIFSLDLHNGRPLTTLPEWENLSPFEIAADFYQRGVRRMILLDLAAVGEARGTPTLPLAAALQRRYPDLELIGGGGVRDAADLAALADSGFSAALVASALHDGSWRG